MADFLAADLRIRRRDAERYLSDQETAEGALDALNANGYLNALCLAASASAAPLLEQLDGEVRAACQQASFAPRYFQYLAVLFAAHHFNRLFADPDALLADLMRFHRQEWDGRNLHRVGDFEPDDLQYAAFWMATAAGKTHILHACLALLDQRRFPDSQGFDRVILITPSEALSRQHAEALRNAMRRPVFVYPDTATVPASPTSPPIPSSSSTSTSSPRSNRAKGYRSTPPSLPTSAIWCSWTRATRGKRARNRSGSASSATSPG
jgi:hypothetical protein